MRLEHERRTHRLTMWDPDSAGGMWNSTGLDGLHVQANGWGAMDKQNKLQTGVQEHGVFLNIVCVGGGL